MCVCVCLAVCMCMCVLVRECMNMFLFLNLFCAPILINIRSDIDEFVCVCFRACVREKQSNEK